MSTLTFLARGRASMDDIHAPEVEPPTESEELIEEIRETIGDEE